MGTTPKGGIVILSGRIFSYTILFRLLILILKYNLLIVLYNLLIYPRKIKPGRIFSYTILFRLLILILKYNLLIYPRKIKYLKY